MPPHWNTRDGPVVEACRKALTTGNGNPAPILVPPGMDPERTRQVRPAVGDAKNPANDWFFETAVRHHRAGKGEPCTGWQPADLGEKPVVPRAETAIETGDPSAVIGFLLAPGDEGLRGRFDRGMGTRNDDPDDVTGGRALVHASLDSAVFAHRLYTPVSGGGDSPR